MRRLLPTLWIANARPNDRTAEIRFCPRNRRTTEDRVQRAGAELGATELKRRFPMLQIRIYYVGANRDTISRLSADSPAVKHGSTPVATRADGIPLSQSGNIRQRFMCGSHHRLGVDVELLVDVGDLSGGAEAVHADEAAFEADIALTRPSLSATFFTDD